MIPADYQGFRDVVLGFAELKGKQLSAPAIELYWRAMQHWTLADFRRAAEHLLRICEFMPVPKDFEDLRKAGRPTAGEAWGEVLECARRGLDPPDDCATAQALRAIGGIRAVAMSETHRTPFLERRFCEHFDAVRDAQDIRAGVPEITAQSRAALKAPA